MASSGMKAIIAIGINFMLRISEIVPGGNTKHYIRGDGVHWIYDEGDKTSKPSGIRITIKSSKKCK